MDGNLSPMQAKILHAIGNGQLKNEHIERGLTALIDAEINQAERPANIELINACEDLLCHLKNHGKTYVSNKEASLRQAKAKLNKHSKKRTTLRNILRVSAAVVILIVSGFGIDMLIRNESLFLKPTEDEQQVEIRGSVIQGTFITDGQADIGQNVNVIGTVELEDAATSLGYYPDVPTWVPDGWKPLDYYASTSRFMSVFRMQYQNSDEKHLIKFSMTRYKDVEMAFAAFQQNQTGDTVDWGGTTVYLSTNIQQPIAVWLEGDTSYSLSGPLTSEEIKQIFDSIQRSMDDNET